MLFDGDGGLLLSFAQKSLLRTAKMERIPETLKVVTAIKVILGIKNALLNNREFEARSGGAPSTQALPMLAMA